MENIEANPTELEPVQSAVEVSTETLQALEDQADTLEKLEKDIIKLTDVSDVDKISDDVTVKELEAFIEGKDAVEIVTELLRDAGHKQPDHWKRFLHADALNLDNDDNIRLFLVKRAIHLGFLSVTAEDIVEQLLYVNSNSVGLAWYVIFKTYIASEMVRLKL